ncbi:hypothetical protein V2J09_008682 [Rumex salicifolius]
MVSDQAEEDGCKRSGHEASNCYQRLNLHAFPVTNRNAATRLNAPGKSPDYGFLKSFGCLCYPFLRPYNNNKLEYRSLPCVFLGYSSKHKGYVCLHVPTARTYVSRYVIFDESVFPYPAHSKPLILSDSPSSDLVPLTLLQQPVISCPSQPVSPGSSDERSLSLDTNSSHSPPNQNAASSPVVSISAGETSTGHTSTSTTRSAPATPSAPPTPPSSASGPPPSSPPPPMPYPNAPTWFRPPDNSSHNQYGNNFPHLILTFIGLELIGRKLKNLRSLTLHTCEGFSTDGLAAIAANCSATSVKWSEF